MTPILDRKRRGPEPYLNLVMVVFILAAIVGLLGMVLEIQALVIIAIMAMLAMFALRVRAHRRRQLEAEEEDQA